jgi:hypothetical protein
VAVTRAPAGANRHAAHGDVLTCIQDYLRAIGAWQLKIWGNPMMRAGVPDLLACVPTRRYEMVPEARRWRSHVLVAVEVKTGTARLSAAQCVEREALLYAGAVYVEAHDLTDLIDALVAQGLAVPLVR